MLQGQAGGQAGRRSTIVLQGQADGQAAYAYVAAWWHHHHHHHHIFMMTRSYTHSATCRAC